MLNGEVKPGDTVAIVGAGPIGLAALLTVSGKIKPAQLITHHFSLRDLLKPYDTFGNAMRERALKVILVND